MPDHDDPTEQVEFLREHFVVESSGLQASVQDADEAVGHLAEGCVMADVAGAGSGVEEQRTGNVR